MKLARTPFFLAAAALFFAGAATSASAAATELMSPHATWRLVCPSGDATLDVVAPATRETAGASPTLRLSIHKAVEPAHGIQLEHVVDQPIEVDHLLHLHFAARSSTGNKM